MKMTFTALAGACLAATTIAIGAAPALAQPHGGGLHGGAGFHGAVNGRMGRGGAGMAARHPGGGSRHNGIRRDRVGDVALFDFGFDGFDPWLYGDPAYYGFADDGYGYGSPYPDEADYPPPPGPDGGNGPPTWQSQPPAPKDQAAPGQNCGSWVWQPDQSRYKWTEC